MKPMEIEKRSFEMLVSVAGIGPKAALSILSYNTPEGLALAQTDAFDPPIGHGYKLVQHHLTATTPQPATTALFVTLLAPYRTGTETPPKATCTRGPRGLRVSWPVQGASPWVVDVPDPAER